MSRRTMIGGIAMILLAAAVAGISGSLYSLGSADFAQHDRQPVDFSHRLHAGELGVACLYCHRFPDVSPVAGIPSVALCMTCHQGMEDQSAETEKLLTHWRDKQPIRWVRLQRLPDHVYFTHEMHVRQGLSCEACHGEVARMRHTPRAPSFEMGWCLTCHEQRGASQDCWTCHK